MLKGITKLISALKKGKRSSAPKVAREGEPAGKRQDRVTAVARAGEEAPRVSAPGCSAAVRQRSIIVGVDFGTSTTKVVWHDTTEDVYEVFQWKTGKGQKTSALLPSMIAVRKGRVWFGHEAAALPDAELRIPWIKVCVLCRNNESVCRHCAHAPERGVVALGPQSRVSAQGLASLFLAYVIGTVETRLSERYSGEHLILQWNVGCPVDHLDSLRARGTYEAMSHFAWQRRSRSSNPISVEEACATDRDIAALQPGEESELPVHIRPETHAGIMAFLQSPHAEERPYVIVDVGAGTTEVSMLLHAQNRAELGHPFFVNYLSDRTLGVGSGDIDRELAERWGVDPETARMRKESGEKPVQRPEAVDRIFKGYREVCCGVAAKKLLPPAQREYDLFILGGGGRMQAVRQVLGKGFPEFKLQLRCQESLVPPRKLKHFDGLERDFDLLALACGLSSTVFWNFRLPWEVQPLAIPHQAAVDKRPDRDELYPK